MNISLNSASALFISKLDFVVESVLSAWLLFAHVLTFESMKYLPLSRICRATKTIHASLWASLSVAVLALVPTSVFGDTGMSNYWYLQYYGVPGYSDCNTIGDKSFQTSDSIAIVTAYVYQTNSNYWAYAGHYVVQPTVNGAPLGSQVVFDIDGDGYMYSFSDSDQTPFYGDQQCHSHAGSGTNYYYPNVFQLDYQTIQAPPGVAVRADFVEHVNYRSLFSSFPNQTAGPRQDMQSVMGLALTSNAPKPNPRQLNLKPNDLKLGGSETHDCGMAFYSAHAQAVSLNIEDTPLRYSPSFGGVVAFKVTYNQRESQQPATFSYSNLGPKWTFGWLSYVTDDPNTPSGNVDVYVPGGGEETYSGFDSATQAYVPDAQSHAVLVRTSSTTYEKRFPDGSKQLFGPVTNGVSGSGRLVFLTQMTDPPGNSVAIGYDSSLRITSLTDALGQMTTLSYELAGDPLKVTKVTDPFGRFATLQYTNGQLTSIIDEIGIQSQFSYQPGSDTISSLTTPYGTTTFSFGENGTNRWIEMTDPLGGKERVEYRDQAPGISASDPVAPNALGVTNAGLDMANTFFWDKKATLVAPGDYTKAQITHWLFNADGSVSGIASSKRQPLENRVWFTYLGQPDYLHAGPSANPSQVAHVLGDGSTQLSQFEYNSIGRTTKTTDPVGRVMSYIYDTNNIDLLEIRQTRGTNSELLRKFTYNSLHEPLSDTDAAGQPTTYTYNAQGQMLTRQNAKNETTTYAYGGAVPTGYLASVTSPPFNSLSAVTSFTYDSFKRVRTVTDSDGYTVTTDYDNLDRKITVTYPDTTYEQFQYTDNITGAMTLDLTGSRDRRGLWTYRHYNANEQMDSITDPANRTTQYGWCTCGALTSITDPKNQTTTFNRDLQSRVYQKVFQDGTTIDYLFEGQTAPNTAGATSRLQSSTDAKSQRTNYAYYADDNVQQVSYTNMAGQPLTPPTPSVSYTYDPNYNRVATMIDGIGTTNYGYNPIAVPPALGAGQLARTDGPLTNDTITFGYDQLGRITNRSINGNANSETWTFDSLGRVITDVNKLGMFTNTYDGVTKRLTKVTDGAGSTNYLYFPNAQDKRLQQIKHLDIHDKLISWYGYTYDAEGQVTTWTKQYASQAQPQRFDLGYDNADQLLTAPLKNASTNALIKQYSYGYDAASNRTSEVVGTISTASTPNSVNEITSQSGGKNRTLTYDLNGSITSDGGTRTFEWDGANRLVAINYTGATTRSEFTYDGLSRIAKIVEKTGSTTNSTRNIAWCGEEKCEFRDGNDAVTHQLYGNGQYSGGLPYYYLRDHLGSIREMVKSGGTSVASRYDYDPYGRSTTILNTTPSDFTFIGLYRHSKSNLDLATYRAYDPDLGRWLSRDPIAEKGGPNLYAYVRNDPMNLWDVLGLTDFNATQTRLLLYRAYRDATEGPLQGLLNIKSNSQGDFDFKDSGDTFCINGKQMSDAAFGNFIAGFAGQAYDDTYGGHLALETVLLFGVGYHIQAYENGKIDFGDILDASGRPDILAGARSARSFPQSIR
jgi:RHS repeat-associated protein